MKKMIDYMYPTIVQIRCNKYQKKTYPVNWSVIILSFGINGTPTWALNITAFIYSYLLSGQPVLMQFPFALCLSEFVNASNDVYKEGFTVKTWKSLLSF